MKMFWIIPVIAGSLVLGGCSGYGNSTPVSQVNTSTPQPVNGTLVKISSFAFNPPSVTIKAGDTVTWENEDSVAHTIKADSFNSDQLQQGQRFSFTFPTAGTYSYICGVHPSMKGTVVVQ